MAPAARLSVKRRLRSQSAHLLPGKLRRSALPFQEWIRGGVGNLAWAFSNCQVVDGGRAVQKYLPLKVCLIHQLRSI